MNETTDYSGMFVYKDDHLDYILTSEGRMKWDDHDGLFHTEYFIKDHLGKVRTVLTIDPNRAFNAQQSDYYSFGLEIPLSGTSDNQLKYNGKFLDPETGLYYYGARYYDPQSSTWLSVDPLAEKYAGWTPYNYCVGNPVVFVDPDGARVVVANKTSEKFVKGDLQKQFGNSKIFRINSYGELKINKRRFQKFFKNATGNQQKLLTGLKEAIKRKETVKVYVNENSNKFQFQDPIALINNKPYREAVFDQSVTVEPISINPYYTIAINNRQASKSTYSTDDTETRRNGKDDLYETPTTIGESASSVLMHELLDEFLNYYTKKVTNDKSPEIQCVEYQNAALENEGKSKRNNHNEKN